MWRRSSLRLLCNVNTVLPACLRSISPAYIADRSVQPVWPCFCQHPVQPHYLEETSLRSFHVSIPSAKDPTTAVRRQPLPQPPQYKRIGRIYSAIEIEPQPIFAIIEAGPAQYKVSPDDLIYTEKLKGLAVNDRFVFKRVLMLGSREETIIGRPFIPDAEVIAAVEEQLLDAKILIFKKRRRKHSQVTKGHRQQLTAVRILEIRGIAVPQQQTEEQLVSEEQVVSATP